MEEKEETNFREKKNAGKDEQKQQVLRSAGVLKTIAG